MESDERRSFETKLFADFQQKKNKNNQRYSRKTSLGAVFSESLNRSS